MAHVQWIDPISDPSWLEFVDASASAGIFHHPKWLDLLRRQYDYELEACCVANGDGIEAAIPVARISSRLTGRRLVSLPFSDACPPALADGAGEDALERLGAALGARSRESGLDLTVRSALPSLPEGQVRDCFVGHHLPLATDPAVVEEHYSKSQVKRGIRKAVREGLQAERRTDVGALDDFYDLHLETRRRLGVPTQSRRFIRRFEQLFEAGLGFVEVVLDDGRPVAAAVFLTHNGTLTYKYGASDADALPKRPNNLLFSEAIRWACEAGLESVDFGRTDLDNEGLRAFKRSWGAEEVDVAYTYLGDRPPSTDPGLADRIMAATIKRSPTFVGRATGVALYRHFG